MPYTLLEHTADIGIVVDEDSQKEAFATAATAMFDIIIDGNIVPEEEKHISLSARDTGRLLVDFLSELLFLFDVEGYMVSQAVISIDQRENNEKEYLLDAKLLGETFQPSRHVKETEIKAVTYHMLEAEKGHLRVLFDI